MDNLALEQALRTVALEQSVSSKSEIDGTDEILERAGIYFNYLVGKIEEKTDEHQN